MALNLTGRAFTWSNDHLNPTFAKVDRFLMSPEWEEQYPLAMVTAMSRGLPDHAPLILLIGPVITMKRPALSAEPQIQVRKLKPTDQFLIFASDGLWEHLSDNDAVQIVFKNPRTGIANRLVRAALKEATKRREVSLNDLKTIERGVRRHFHDDISVVVVYLDRHRGRRQTRVVDSSMNCTSAPIDIYSSSVESVQARKDYRDSG